MSVAAFLEENFKHFNARETLDAAKAWVDFLKSGNNRNNNKMFLALGGAMSTGELGISLARMIRAGLIHGISSTAANVEEDIYNLLAHNEYRMVPRYRDLTPADEEKLRDAGYNRVTDTCIPETAMRHIDAKMLEYWREAERKREAHFPVEYFTRLIEEGVLDQYRQIPREHSWVIAAYEAGIPVYTPGWEDSTTGNSFAALVLCGRLRSHAVIRHGTEQMEHLARWYLENTRKASVGFFQIGGGIAGDFAICVTPMLIKDVMWLEEQEKKPQSERLVGEHPKFWDYFAQISDSTTSYGSYSGAVPNEKITWWKIDKDCPKFMINGDASVIAPLVFTYVLEKSAERAARAEATVVRRTRTKARVVPAAVSVRG